EEKFIHTMIMKNSDLKNTKLILQSKLEARPCRYSANSYGMTVNSTKVTITMVFVFSDPFLLTLNIRLIITGNALLEDNKVWHLVRSVDEVEKVKSKGGSMKEKAKAITEIYLTQLLSVKVSISTESVKYFFDFLDEHGKKHENIWKTNSLSQRFWVNILKNPHFIFDICVHEVVDASLSVITQTFMDACTKSDHKLSRDLPSSKLFDAKEISTYKKMVDDDQDMNTDLLNTQVAVHQLYQYASKYYDEIINALDEVPATENKQLILRLQQTAAALGHKVTDL
uniref:Plexin cytoplasmic RasGAP domain-containing protein n=1 Tax=Erpetoichthys calabaricus TaxID=27687 RepID=A0A8C4SH55_ERPCA